MLEDGIKTAKNAVWKQSLHECTPLFLFWLFSLVLGSFLILLYRASLEIIVLFALITFGFLILYFLRRMLENRKVLAALKANDLQSAALHGKAGSLYYEQIAALHNELVLEKTKSMEAQNSLQDSFDLWIHQIKLPLASLCLQLDAESLSPSLLKEDVSRLSHCVSMAISLVRIEQSDYVFKKENLSDIARDTIRSFARECIAKNISLHFAKPEEETFVLTDKKWAAVLFEQLFSNAVKYCPPHGSITVCVSGTSLSVHNSGPLIPAQDLPRIFEKGFTGSAGHQNTSASSGLGLYLCTRISSSLHCTLAVDNEAEGVKASVTFPDVKTVLD
jgi:hypothetical protein